MLYLRSSARTEDHMVLQIETPGGNVSYKVPIIKMQSYTLREIFEKKLLFLIVLFLFVMYYRFIRPCIRRNQPIL